ncbi:hypothetical protein ACOBQX_14655 [Actinokineospora sp. G85]|uniref:hypothetical protein n=1 Tax=Actinokineospora sp. G85 TaxID=3406626 RepID=UPI003C73E35A
MIYLLAIVGAVTVAVLLWKALAPQVEAAGAARGKRGLAPDDDPDFLRGLDQRKKPEDGAA